MSLETRLLKEAGIAPAAGRDLHKERAAALFLVPYGEVTSAQRKEAKRLWFFNNYCSRGLK